jgi:hypothetical protein
LSCLSTHQRQTYVFCVFLLVVVCSCRKIGPSLHISVMSMIPTTRGCSFNWRMFCANAPASVQHVIPVN